MPEEDDLTTGEETEEEIEDLGTDEEDDSESDSDSEESSEESEGGEESDDSSGGKPTAKRGRPTKEPPPPKIWRLEGASPEGMRVTLGRFTTKEEAEPELERLLEDGFYEKLKIVKSEEDAPASQ